MVIVVVDDEPDARVVARLVLERAGHDVLVARHGADALVLLDDHDVEVVLTDLHMPRMDGRELAEAVHRDHPDVHVVLWSTSGDGSDGVRPKDMRALEIVLTEGRDGTGTTEVDDRG